MNLAHNIQDPHTAVAVAHLEARANQTDKEIGGLRELLAENTKYTGEIHGMVKTMAGTISGPQRQVRAAADATEPKEPKTGAIGFLTSRRGERFLWAMLALLLLLMLLAAVTGRNASSFLPALGTAGAAEPVPVSRPALTHEPESP